MDLTTDTQCYRCGMVIPTYSDGYDVCESCTDDYFDQRPFLAYKVTARVGWAAIHTWVDREYNDILRHVITRHIREHFD